MNTNRVGKFPRWFLEENFKRKKKLNSRFWEAYHNLGDRMDQFQEVHHQFVPVEQQKFNITGLSVSGTYRIYFLVVTEVGVSTYTPGVQGRGKDFRVGPSMSAPPPPQMTWSDGSLLRVGRGIMIFYWNSLAL
jgi:hypothetical protein